MLIWLAEAAGVAKRLIRKTFRVLPANARDTAAVGRLVREVLPWHAVEAALLRKRMKIAAQGS
jgi:hypothetical protein